MLLTSSRNALSSLVRRLAGRFLRSTLSLSLFMSLSTWVRVRVRVRVRLGVRARVGVRVMGRVRVLGDLPVHLALVDLEADLALPRRLVGVGVITLGCS